MPRRGLLAGALASTATLLGPPRRTVAGAPPPLRARPATFEVSTTEALVWVAAREASTIRVAHGPEGEPAETRLSAPVNLSADTDYTAAVPLHGLQPDRAYRYRVVGRDGADAGDEHAGRFRTAPATAREVVFAYGADTHADFRPFRIFDLIADSGAEFFLHLGDTCYADQPRRQFRPVLAHYREKHREIRTDPHLQALLARVPAFAVWDDHEVENDFDATHPALAEGLRAFREAWPVATGDPRRLYRRVAWSPLVDLFILDARQYRSPAAAPDDGAKTILGAAQRAWLRDGLRASTAPVKFLCTSVPFHAAGPDKWGGYRTERDALARFIRDERIRTVIVLSGDLHLAVDHGDRTTGLAELTVGPLGAKALLERSPTARPHLAGLGPFVLGDRRNFGLVRVRPEAGRASVELSVVDDAGQTRYRRVVPA